MSEDYGELVTRLRAHRTDEADLLALLMAAASSIEELVRKNDQLRQDRYDALSVTSKDGLLSSEWVARTGKAERDRKQAESRADQLAAEVARQHLRAVQAEDTVARFRIHHPQALAERDAARAALRLVEWIEGMGGVCYCPSCGRERERGHADDCDTKVALGERLEGGQ